MLSIHEYDDDDDSSFFIRNYIHIFMKRLYWIFTFQNDVKEVMRMDIIISLFCLLFNIPLGMYMILILNNYNYLNQQLFKPVYIKKQRGEQIIRGNFP